MEASGDSPTAPRAAASAKGNLHRQWTVQGGSDRGSGRYDGPGPLAPLSAYLGTSCSGSTGSSTDTFQVPSTSCPFQTPADVVTVAVSPSCGRRTALIGLRSHWDRRGTEHAQALVPEKRAQNGLLLTGPGTKSPPISGIYSKWSLGDSNP